VEVLLRPLPVVDEVGLPCGSAIGGKRSVAKERGDGALSSRDRLSGAEIDAGFNAVSGRENVVVSMWNWFGQRERQPSTSKQRKQQWVAVWVQAVEIIFTDGFLGREELGAGR
jgi:hypothetical protein